MKFFRENCGIFVLLIGTLFLILPFFFGKQTMTTLSTAWVLIVTGFVLYIILNKKIR
jgi:VIT1/CCC1 family predicted Fe2+/Mn2+ transporter